MDTATTGTPPAGSTPLKPLPARLIEARDRARQRRVRVFALEAARRYLAHSASRPGLAHTITRAGGAWRCSCEGYHYTGCCQHLAAVERRAEREGWRFGRIAALPVVAPA